MSEEILKLNLQATKGRLPVNLVWLADAPLFIDASQVERFYDAVVRPDGKQEQVKLTLTEERVKELQGTLGLEAGLTPGQFGAALATVLPFLPSIKATGEANINATQSSEKSLEITLREISSPQRQLEQLVLHYLFNHPARLFISDQPVSARWREPAVAAAVPRAIVFLDLAGRKEAERGGVPQTRLIPTAAEFVKGEVELLYEQLKGRAEGDSAPDYPEAGTSAQMTAYWKWFSDNFSATNAMIAVENAATKCGRINWIDFRLPLTLAGDTLHLHVSPAGQYDTGVLAYNFIKRGHTHGVRIIGTLKSGPDINVLAIYEK